MISFPKFSIFNILLLNFLAFICFKIDDQIILEYVIIVNITKIIFCYHIFLNNFGGIIYRLIDWQLMVR